MSSFFSPLLPLRGLTITLRFTSHTRLPFFHQAAVTAWLRHLLDSPGGYEKYLCIDTPESGCVEYRRGDNYRFCVFVAAGGGVLLQTLLDKLYALPDSVTLRDKNLPLRDNLTLVSVADFFSATRARHGLELQGYDAAALDAEVSVWQYAPACRIRWLSPVRLLLDKSQRGEDYKGEARFCRRSGELPYELLQQRLHDTLNALLRERGMPPPPQTETKLLAPLGERGKTTVLHSDVFWLDNSYRSHVSGRQQPMGGLLGAIEVETTGFSPQDWRLWVLGQYLGIGQRRVFGWGRYALESLDGDMTLQRPLQATHLLQRAAERTNVQRAYAVMRENAVRFSPPEPPVAEPPVAELVEAPPVTEPPVAELVEAPPVTEPPLPEPVEGREKTASGGLIGELDAAGQMLFITGKPCVITTQKGRVFIEQAGDGDKPASLDVPWNHLQALVLFGTHHITTPALKAAFRHRVPVHFASAGGHYQGIANAPGDESLWLAQQLCFSQADKALAAARSVVEARLRHQREVLRLRNISGQFDTVLVDLKALAEKAQTAAGLTQLNGFEGQGGKLYFAALREVVPEAFGFDGRNRRPPRDPFNVLLSLGYTILYAHVETVCRASGLQTGTGFYHQPHGNHATLASDLMEPLRHMVERAALSAVNKKQIKPDDFFMTDDNACRIDNAARKTWLTLLSETFERPFLARGDAQPYKLHAHLRHQNLRLIAWIRDKDDRFEAWRWR
jgi:CRISPR-associated endonuclease Cas1